MSGGGTAGQGQFQGGVPKTGVSKPGEYVGGQPGANPYSYGGVPKGTDSTTSELPPQWYQDYARDFLGYASQVAQLPWEGYGQQRVADLSPTQRGAIGNLGGLANGTGYTDAAGGMLEETLRGGGMNPYMDGVVGRVTGDVTRAYQDATNQNLTRFRGPNRNSSGFDQAQENLDFNLARGLTDGIAPIISGGYEAERGRQMGAVGAASGLLGSMGGANMNALNAGGIEQMQEQRLYDTDYGDWRDWRNYPNQQLGVFGDALRSVSGNQGRTSTTSTPDPDRASQYIGLISGLLSMFGGNK